MGRLFIDTTRALVYHAVIEPQYWQQEWSSIQRLMHKYLFMFFHRGKQLCSQIISGVCLTTFIARFSLSRAFILGAFLFRHCTFLTLLLSSSHLKRMPVVSNVETNCYSTHKHQVTWCTIQHKNASVWHKIIVSIMVSSRMSSASRRETEIYQKNTQKQIICRQLEVVRNSDSCQIENLV